MKVLAITANNRRRLFEVHTRRQDLTFPFAKAEPAPSPADRLVEVFVDPEIGNEGFTYRLQSGAEGTVHIDEVLEYNEDPSYMADLALYRLTVEAKKRYDDSELSAREIARALGTSPAQLYRLLDPTNYSKSVRQLMTLLYVLGCEVDFEVKGRRSRDRERRAASAHRVPALAHDPDGLGSRRSVGL